MSFNVKKMGSASAVALALFAASWGAHAAEATSAVVNITATVVGKTCTPSWTSGSTVSVDLGKVSTANLAAQGDVGAEKPFTLSLSDCDSGVAKVAVTATGSADGTDATAFKNTGSATGVAVTLFGGDDGTTQLLPDGTTAAEYTVTNGAASMPFLAKLVRSAAADSGDTAGVANGTVSSTATLYMTYQ